MLLFLLRGRLRPEVKQSSSSNSSRRRPKERVCTTPSTPALSRTISVAARPSPSPEADPAGGSTGFRTREIQVLRTLDPFGFQNRRYSAKEDLRDLVAFGLAQLKDLVPELEEVVIRICERSIS